MVSSLDDFHDRNTCLTYLKCLEKCLLIISRSSRGRGQTGQTPILPRRGRNPGRPRRGRGQKYYRGFYPAGVGV